MAKKKVGKKTAIRKKRAAKRKSSARKSPRKNNRFTSFFKRWLVRMLLLGTAIGAAGLFFYSFYLNQVVTTKFEGKRWAVPARVYARPLELYAGADVTRQQLEAEIKRLGYRQQKQPGAPGTWKKTGDSFLIYTRAFHFWDEEVPTLALKISYLGQNVASIVNLETRQEEAIIRLEAPMIESIYPAHNEDRILVRNSDIPELLIDTLIAVEDRDFFSHHGVNPKSIARAMWINLRAGSVVQGGSTLTQQLVKNFFLTSERTLVRKLNEALMSLIVDWRYDKHEILQAYANEIYLGQQGRRAIHGFGLASLFYFNRPLKELDIPRIALLVGMIKGPSYYDPRRHPERAKKRRDLVLDVMLKQGLISDKQQTQASMSDLGVIKSGQQGARGYPAFIQLVRKQLQRDYREEDLTSEGLRIFTTLDPWIQKRAEDKVRMSLESLEKQHKLPKGKLQAAAVIAEVTSGEILAVVGGRETRYSGFNRALNAIRPIGSLVKPFVYLTAFMQPEKYSLISKINDEPVELVLENGDIWKPENYDRQLHGEVPLINALARSYNLATVNLGMQVGLEKIKQTLQKAGVSKDFNAYPSMLLGALSLSPLDVAQTYQTLAAGGFRSPLRAIREVLDAHNEPLQRYPLTVKQTLPSAPVYLTNIALQRVVNVGTARGLNSLVNSSYQLAGKTGTTNDLRDSWFAGFSNNHVGAVWVGRDDNQAAGLTGAEGAMRVWGNIFAAIRTEPLRLDTSSDTELVLIDDETGLRASEKCENTVQVPFVKGYAPQENSPCVKKNMGLFERIFQ